MVYGFTLETVSSAEDIVDEFEGSTYNGDISEQDRLRLIKLVKKRDRAMIREAMQIGESFGYQQANKRNKMSEFKQYKRNGVTEMTPWTPDTDMTNVSVSEKDKLDGCPKTGDYIARNPASHSDRWLVSAAFFKSADFVVVE